MAGGERTDGRTDGWSFLHRRHLPRSQARVAGRDGDKDRSDGKRKRDGEKLREFPSRFAQIWFLNRVRHFSFILCFTISVLQIHTFVLPLSKSHSCYFKHRRLMHRTKQAYRACLKGGPQVSRILFLLLLTTSTWLCLQHSRNLGPAFLPSPVCGFSMMEQGRLCAVRPMENWLCSSLNQIQGWTTV